MAPDEQGRDAGLTKNQAMVMTHLQRAQGPMSAYDILDGLRSQGLKAPQQVYRALDKLLELGKVHKLESLNAFVACQHADHDDHGFAAFTICQDCGQVQEITGSALEGYIVKLAREAQFVLHKTTVELRGLCAACKLKAAG